MILTVELKHVDEDPEAKALEMLEEAIQNIARSVPGVIIEIKSIED